MPAQNRPTDLKELTTLAREGTLFAVLDACDEPAVLARVTKLGEAAAPCLYRAVTDPRTLAAAPYLVKLDPPLLEWIVATLWSKPWGILLVARSDLKTLRHHLRKFLVVKGPDGAALYFRFYDPRVLETFLASCTKEELAAFFGPVLAYGVADAVRGGAVLTRMP